MRLRLSPILLLYVFFCFLFSWHIQARASEAVSPEGFIREALENNPALKQAYHDWKSSRYSIDNVTGLSDPGVSYGYFGESVETRLGPQEHKFGVSQKIPFPGKLAYRGKVRAKEARILEEKYKAAKSEIIKDVKTVFYDLYWLDRAFEVNTEEKSILEEAEKIARKKYESNLSSQQDVTRLQLELSKIIERLSLIEQNRQSLAAKLNSLLDRDMSSPVEKTGDITTSDFPYGLEELMEMSKVFRQELTAANLAVEKSEYERSLAGMDYLPDFTFGYEYTEIGSGTTSALNDGEDAWMGKISVNVPIWFGKIKSGIKAKEEALKAAQENKKDIENSIEYEVSDIYFRITTYREIISLYESALIPQAEQAFDVSQSGFEKGSVSFIDWLDTHRTYLHTRLAYYKAISDYEKSIAFLERIIGRRIGEEYD